VTINASLLILCASCVVHADQDFVHQEFEKIVGHVQLPQSKPTVRQAAKEYIIGRHLAASDQHIPAIAHFRRSAELDSKSAAPWAGLAISFSAVGRQESSLLAWNETLKRDHLHEDALLVVGLDDARNGRFELGQKKLAQHWLIGNPTPVEALLRFAGLRSVFRSQEQLVCAIQLESDSIVNNAVHSLAPAASPPVWLGVLQQLIDLSANDLALELTSKAIQQNLDNRELGTLLTVLPVLEESNQGDGSITLQRYEEVASEQQIPLSPKWYEPVSLSDALSIAAQSMSIIGDDGDASTMLYRTALESNPLNPLVLNNLAWILLNHVGPTEEVQQLCIAALELAPNAAYIKDTVGWMYVLLGEPEKAIPLFLKALESSNEPSVEILDHLGDAFWLTNRKEEAFEVWQTALSILESEEYRQRVLEGFLGMARTVWGITVITPEQLYDFEFADITRRLKEKLTAADEGGVPTLGIAVQRNGAK